MARGEAAEIRLEDNTNGELFALCPFTPASQAVAIEPTVDSSRYLAEPEPWPCNQHNTSWATTQHEA